jgi:hypothetical protein
MRAYFGPSLRRTACTPQGRAGSVPIMASSPKLIRSESCNERSTGPPRPTPDDGYKQRKRVVCDAADRSIAVPKGLLTPRFDAGRFPPTSAPCYRVTSSGQASRRPSPLPGQNLVSRSPSYPAWLRRTAYWRLDRHEALCLPHQGGVRRCHRSRQRVVPRPCSGATKSSTGSPARF